MKTCLLFVLAEILHISTLYLHKSDVTIVDILILKTENVLCCITSEKNKMAAIRGHKKSIVIVWCRINIDVLDCFCIVLF